MDKTVFISHASQDSKIAIRIAQNLEQQGYSTWYYERDSKGGGSHLEQSAKAIENAQAFLLLISEDSLQSIEVDSEFDKARREERDCVHLRVRMSDEEFRKRKPKWDMAIGSVVTTEISKQITKSIVSRIVEALENADHGERNNIPSRRSTDEVSTSEDSGAAQAGVITRVGLRDPWPSDASQIGIHDLKGIVFKNDLIEGFLQGKTKFFLSGNKGLGKTLLLRYKRSILSDQYQDIRPGRKQSSKVSFIPEDKPFLDMLAELSSVSEKHQEFLESCVNTKRLWSFALRVSALSHHPLVVRDDEPELAELDSRLKNWLLGEEQVVPTAVFREMLSRSVSEINKTMDRVGGLLDHRFRKIHSATHIFIDRVDEGLRNLSRKAWIAVQGGLVDAAWDLWSACNHVKIYATIRQEAYSNYESGVKANLHGAVTNIQYTREELQALLDQLAQSYEGKTFKQFVGLEDISHPSRPFREDSFDYVHRHTFGRPRDLVIISAELSNGKRQLDDKTFRRQIAETSSAELATNLFGEMRVFLDSLNDKDRRRHFLSLLPCNIIKREEAEKIYCEFNRIDASSFETIDPYGDTFDHPFWEMYSAGLLGIVADDPDRRMIQKFKQPDDMIHDSQSALPNVDYYFIHPALDSYIRNTTGKYNVCQHVTVGHLCPWKPYFEIILNIERYLFTIRDYEARDLTFDVLNRITKNMNSDGRFASESVDQAEWSKLQSKLKHHDEIMYWLEELVSRS